MSWLSALWLLVGIQIGVAATLILSGFWRNTLAASSDKTRSVVYGASGLIAFSALAVGLYLKLGAPLLVTHDLDSRSAPANHAALIPATSDAGSMEAMTERLATRLSREGGADSDWELLAQSYEMLGRSAEAQQARNHVATAASDARPSANTTPSLLAQAETERRNRQYVAARKSYEATIKAGQMTADAWANYADVIGSQANGKLADGADAIEQALRLQPNHTKALWLKASLAHEQRRYGDALNLWTKLRTIVDDDSSDARILDDNITEAQQLANSGAKQVASPISLEGSVDIDPALRARAPAGATLFVFAKALDGAGPPIAVWRTTVDHWPRSFKLDDAMAMLPSRTLSQFEQVLVEARVSRSGAAMASSGDLQAPGVVVSTRKAKALRLRIAHEVSR